MLRHWCPEQLNAKQLVKWKDLLSGQWKGPDPLLTSGRGCACIFPQDADSPVWIPDRLICHYFEGHSSAPAAAATTRNSRARGAVGGASLAAGAQCTVLAGSSPASVCARLAAGKRDKINIEIPAGLTAAAVRTLDQEMILFTLF